MIVHIGNHFFMASNVVSADDKKFLKKLGARIRELRSAKGWTLEETEEYG